MRADVLVLTPDGVELSRDGRPVTMGPVRRCSKLLLRLLDPALRVRRRGPAALIIEPVGAPPPARAQQLDEHLMAALAAKSVGNAKTNS